MAGRSMGTRRQAERTRKNLLAAAAEIFDRQGYGRARLEDVCARAGVTKGALYCHFPSKHALAVALLEGQSGIWYDVRAQLERRGVYAMQALIDLSYEIGDRLRNDLLMRVAHRVLFDERVFDLVAAGQFISWIAIVRDLLTKAVATGELCDGVDVGSAAESIIAYLTGTTLLSRAMCEYDDLRVQLTAMWRFWILVLVPPNRRAGLRIEPPPWLPVV